MVAEMAMYNVHFDATYKWSINDESKWSFKMYINVMLKWRSRVMYILMQHENGHVKWSFIMCTKNVSLKWPCIYYMYILMQHENGR
jgi:hypothetical protein